ncbi:hypothetical protein [Mucilaginibacter celer]|uniref:Uncharacterized protein n=1 Tax=Mucilaginibacter celer TaxID=2305508 RepID=A0A494VU60_9SPHI|nr:hypothetical protein [Mucilaginibacter celer]AYL94868.1 hypothetical protein HYN43_005930 [Mucilaginibacter celer]
MDLFESVFELYEQVRLKAEADFQDLIKTQYTQQCYSDNGAFCLVLEISVLKNSSDDDYGLLLSINAQTEPNYGGIKHDTPGIYLIAELLSGDHQHLEAVDEVFFDPANEAEVEATYGKIEQFIKPLTGNISSILAGRYDVQPVGA